MTSKSLNALSITAISIGAIFVCVAIYAFIVTIIKYRNAKNIADIAKRGGVMPPRPEILQQ